MTTTSKSLMYGCHSFVNITILEMILVYWQISQQNRTNLVNHLDKGNKPSLTKPCMCWGKSTLLWAMTKTWSTVSQARHTAQPYGRPLIKVIQHFTGQRTDLIGWVGVGALLHTVSQISFFLAWNTFLSIAKATLKLNDYERRKIY